MTEDAFPTNYKSPLEGLPISLRYIYSIRRDLTTSTLTTAYTRNLLSHTTQLLPSSPSIHHQPQSTYLKYLFSLSVKSMNAHLSLSSSSIGSPSLFPFSLFSTTYNATAARIVMQ